ncbi:MAG: CBS domain-containing protein [Methanosarcinales archaeon Met12]|nr:MAG: CBS domain-containing protein [Methanosarcinales archaeon Met12]
MELPPIQREILAALINMVRQKNEAVRGEEIARIINRNPGTVRNQMQTLKVLQLVEGIPGPKGGYIPTGKAYEVIGIEKIDEEAMVRIHRDGSEIEGATVSEISFTTIRHPYLCYASIKVIGNIRSINTGDKITIGPTPVNKLMIRGEVYGRNDVDNVILCSIVEMISLPKRLVKEYVPKKMVSLTLDSTIQEAARVLIKHNIHGAPVMENDEILGIVSFTDIGRAISRGEPNALVEDIMSKDVITIDGERPLNEAIKAMNEHKIGRLIVTEKGKMMGIITRTDVLSGLAVY